MSAELFILAATEETRMAAVLVANLEMVSKRGKNGSERFKAIVQSEENENMT